MPVQDVKLYGIVKVKGFWLPFAFLGLKTVMGQVRASHCSFACGLCLYIRSARFMRCCERAYTLPCVRPASPRR